MSAKRAEQASYLLNFETLPLKVVFNDVSRPVNSILRKAKYILLPRPNFTTMNAHLRALLIALFTITSVPALFAQNLDSLFAVERKGPFAVKLGDFLDPKIEQFANVTVFGQLYVKDQELNTQGVYVGDYEELAVTKEIAEKLNALGYREAFPISLHFEQDELMTFVHLGTHPMNQRVNWEQYTKINNLYFVVEKGQTKVLSGPFASQAVAQTARKIVLDEGFSTATVRSFNVNRVHPVDEFLTGIRTPLPAAAKTSAPPEPTQLPTPVQQPELIAPEQVMTAPPATSKTTTPIADSPQANSIEPANNPDPVVVQEASVVAAAPANRPTRLTIPLPDNHPKVKRTSALQLQLLLKPLGFYDSSVDGYYGAATGAAFEQARLNYPELSEAYRVTAITKSVAGITTNLSLVIESMGQNKVAATSKLGNIDLPLAKAYRAYGLFSTQGPNSEVDALLASIPNVSDVQNTTYTTLEQVIDRVASIHSSQGKFTPIPCWWFAQHPETAIIAFAKYTNKHQSSLPFPECGSTIGWETLDVTQRLAEAFAKPGGAYRNTPSIIDWATLLFKTDQITAVQQADALTWRDQLVKKVESISGSEEKKNAFMLSFNESWATLENHFLSNGATPRDAKGLAAYGLQAYIGDTVAAF